MASPLTTHKIKSVISSRETEESRADDLSNFIAGFPATNTGDIVSALWACAVELYTTVHDCLPLSFPNIQNCKKGKKPNLKMADTFG